jgi:ankyrin repeat protein
MVIRRSTRHASLLLSVALLTCAACDTKSADARRVFSDTAAAQVAEAAAAGDTARVNTLIKGGANPNAIGDKGVSLLQWAMLNESKTGVEALLTAGADPAHADDTGDTVMHYAAKFKDPAYLDVLLAHRVDPNTPNLVTGRTPMMSALFGDRAAQFHKLLAAGADPNLTDQGGDTSLHIAAKIKQFQLALDLLNAAADPAVRNKQGVTFQRYLYMTPTNIMSDDARRQRERLMSWLREHNVPLDVAQPHSR